MKVPACPTNLNTNWLDNKGVWLFYVGLILLSWLILSGWTDPGLAWWVQGAAPREGRGAYGGPPLRAGGKPSPGPPARVPPPGSVCS